MPVWNPSDASDNPAVSKRKTEATCHSSWGTRPSTPAVLVYQHAGASTASCCRVSPTSQPSRSDLTGRRRHGSGTCRRRRRGRCGDWTCAGAPRAVRSQRDGTESWNHSGTKTDVGPSPRWNVSLVGDGQKRLTMAPSVIWPLTRPDLLMMSTNAALTHLKTLVYTIKLSNQLTVGDRWSGSFPQPNNALIGSVEGS